MEEDMKKLVELIGNKKNYTTKTQEELEQLYMKVFGNGDKENEAFLKDVELHIVSYSLNIVLQHHPWLDLREIGMARYGNFLLFTLTKPCKENRTEIITGIDESEDVLFKIDEKIGASAPEIKALYLTTTTINDITGEKIVDDRGTANQREMKKMRSNGSNSTGRTKICKSKLRIDYNQYREKHELLHKEMVHLFEDNSNSLEETIIPQEDTLRIKQLNLESKQLLSNLKHTVDCIETTHREYVAQQIDDSLSGAERIEEEEERTVADERLDVRTMAEEQKELDFFFGNPNVQQIDNANNDNPIEGPIGIEDIDIKITDIEAAVQRRKIQRFDKGDK